MKKFVRVSRFVRRITCFHFSKRRKFDRWYRRVIVKMCLENGLTEYAQFARFRS